MDDEDNFNKLLERLKNDINQDNMNRLYEIRKKIYTLESTNMEEILDYIIEKFNINPANGYFKDMERLFNSAILGYNKNYIIYYMVLLRFAIKNKIQMDDNYSFTSFLSINSMLSDELNSDDYLPLFVELMNQYIASFPIKKTLNVSNIKKKLDSYYTNYQIVVSYDMKNKMIFYESGDVKGVNRITYDDIKQILYALLNITTKSYQ